MEERVSSFDPEGPLMEKLSIVADLLFLNLIVFLCCIPVITAGAAMTGMHYVLIKMIRREESYVLTDFFYSFRKNFRQATVIWCLYLLFAAVLALDLYLTRGGGETAVRLPVFFRYLLIGGGAYAGLTLLYVFPLLARFDNTVRGTIRSAFALVVSSLPCTISMVMVTLGFPAAARLMPALLPLEILLGLTGPGFLCALLYNPLFLKIEKKIKSR